MLALILDRIVPITSDRLFQAGVQFHSAQPGWPSQATIGAAIVVPKTAEFGHKLVTKSSVPREN
jgi:hypothetical protein